MARSKNSAAEAISGSDKNLATFGISPAETLHALLQLSNKVSAPFAAHLEHQYDISMNEFRSLMMIGRYGPIASHEIAAMTGVNIMSISRAVSVLQKHGRILVERDPKNGRRKTLTLTAEGRRLFEIMLPQTDKVAEYLLSDLRADEIMALNHYLGTLIKTLEATDENGKSLFLERTRPNQPPLARRESAA